MHTRVKQWWYAAQESLWLLPGALTVAGALLALGMVQLDHILALDQRQSRIWAFGGGAEGARGVLQAIAGSLITVTATVFSITIVTLQLASTQFTPRVLRTFTRDRGVQLALGVFIGTFTYSLLVLRAVRSRDNDFQRFVPSLSVLVAILLAMLCVGFLIYIVHHVAQMIRVPAVVGRVVEDGERLIEQRFPAGIGEPVCDGQRIEPTPAAHPVVVPAASAGYLQSIDVDALFGLASETPLTIQVERVIGEFIIQGEPLATIWPGTGCTKSVVDTIRGSCMLGTERTLESDLTLPIRQLADIAVKALSPGINDPTTAITCIDHLANLLVRAARRGDPPAAFRRAHSPVCLIVRSPSFDALVDTGFAQVRYFGTSDPHVATHLLGVLDRIVTLVPPEYQTALRREAEMSRTAVLTRGRTTSAWERQDTLREITEQNVLR